MSMFRCPDMFCLSQTVHTGVMVIKIFWLNIKMCSLGHLKLAFSIRFGLKTLYQSIIMNSWPKVTKVDLKITKKWSVYEVKLFYGGHWGTPLTDPLKYIEKYSCLYVWISSRVQNHRLHSERAETLTDFPRGCNNNDASVRGSNT